MSVFGKPHIPAGGLADRPGSPAMEYRRFVRRGRQGRDRQRIVPRHTDGPALPFWRPGSSRSGRTFVAPRRCIGSVDALLCCRRGRRCRWYCWARSLQAPIRPPAVSDRADRAPHAVADVLHRRLWVRCGVAAGWLGLCTEAGRPSSWMPMFSAGFLTEGRAPGAGCNHLTRARFPSTPRLCVGFALDHGGDGRGPAAAYSCS